MNDSDSMSNTSSLNNNKLVLFDFDGTLTKRDTLLLFLRFAGGVRFYLLLPIFALLVLMYKLKLISAKKSKEAIFSCMFKGYEKDRLSKLGQEFIDKLLMHKEKYFRENALETVISSKETGARVIIVSASPDVWIEPFAKSLGVEYLSTRFAYVDDKFAGCFFGENCTKAEKVSRIKEYINDLSSYHIEAYGDTKGDIAMLKLADKSYYQYFS